MNPEPFKVSLFPAGSDKHYIRVRKKIRISAGLKIGDRVTVKIRVLDRDKSAKIPKDLLEKLQSENVVEDFKSIPPGARNYIIRRIEEAVRAETRMKRIMEAVEAARDRRR